MHIVFESAEFFFAGFPLTQHDPFESLDIFAPGLFDRKQNIPVLFFGAQTVEPYPWVCEPISMRLPSGSAIIEEYMPQGSRRGK